MDISKNSTAKYIGRAALRVGQRPTKLYYPRLEIAETISNENCPGEFSGTIWNKVVVGAGTVGAKFQLANFSKGKLNIPKSYKRTKLLISKFLDRNQDFGAVNVPYRGMIRLMNFRPDTLPGGDSSNYYSKKIDGWMSITEAASRLWDKVHANPTVCVSTYTTGARAKSSIDKAYGSEIYSRNVMQQDAVNFFMSKPYVYQIERAIFNSTRSNLVIGKSTVGYEYDQLLYRNRTHNWALEFDWSLYDSSIIRDKIVGAFAIARAFFPPSDQIDNFFIYECNHLIDKFVVAPDGNLFKIQRGMPSGSGWTTVINSLVNALLMEEIGMSYPGFRNESSFTYQVAGDDGVMYLNDRPSKKIDVRDLEDWCLKRFGMKLEVSSVGSPIRRSPDKSITFNKLCYYKSKDGRVVPTVPPKALFKRMVAIQKNVNVDKTFFDNVDGQTDQLLGYPPCQEFIALLDSTTVLLNTRAGVDADSQFSSSLSVIKGKVNKLYFSEGTTTLSQSSIYDGDKIKPLEVDSLWAQQVDSCFVDNWLYDNTVSCSFDKPGYHSRKNWMNRMMGVRGLLEKVTKLTDLEKAACLAAGVPASLFVELLQDYQEWQL